MPKPISIHGDAGNWSTVVCDGIEIGGYGETTRTEAHMRWFWSGQGRFGHCARRDEAIAELVALAPEALDRVAAERARHEAFRDLPDDLQKLKAALDTAEFERARVWGRNPFNAADYTAASGEFSRAYTAFHVAHDRWQCRRRAA